MKPLVNYLDYLQRANLEKLRHEKAMNALRIQLTHLQDQCPHKFKTIRHENDGGDKVEAWFCAHCNQRLDP